jgi:hypothetical protein
MNLIIKKKYLMAACVRSIALCCSLLGAGFAAAGPSDRYDQGRGQESRDDGQRGHADAHQQQGQDPRAYQRQEQRRMIEVQAPERGDARRTGRMTADERRDLRRQINEVGQDLYSNPPRR